jgi:hypothetical protein
MPDDGLPGDRREPAQTGRVSPETVRSLARAGASPEFLKRLRRVSREENHSPPESGPPTKPEGSGPAIKADSSESRHGQTRATPGKMTFVGRTKQEELTQRLTIYAKERAEDEVRRLARAGELTNRFRDGSRNERRRLRAGAAEIAGPLVYERVTKPVERKRGHYECAATPRRMLPDCLDQFHDDVDAVLDDLFAHADLPIVNLEGWLTSRLVRATVDGYRRRRGERGAPQRPRVPGWLADALGKDAWLIDLATAILEWVGTEATAGSSLWPLNAFGERRVAHTGDHLANEAVVADEVEVVLAAMRRRPNWYKKYVERPFGRKQAPVWSRSNTSIDALTEPAPLALVDLGERDEAVLRELASLALKVMTARIDRGEDAAAVVTDVLGTVFGSPPASHELERAPADEGNLHEVAARINDPVKLKQIAAVVLELLDDRGSGDLVT